MIAGVTGEGWEASSFGASSSVYAVSNMAALWRCWELIECCITCDCDISVMVLGERCTHVCAPSICMYGV